MLIHFSNESKEEQVHTMEGVTKFDTCIFQDMWYFL